MCLTKEALLVFLGMLSPDLIDVGEDRIVVRAETRNVIWTVKGEDWCTPGPKLDRSLRLRQGDAA